MMRIKRFSGYSEAAPGGVSYYSGQVVSKYILDPLDKGMEKVDELSGPISSDRFREKKARIKGIIKPLKKILGGSDKNK